VAHGVVFANGINWPGFLANPPQPPVEGNLFAVSGDGATVLWNFMTPSSPNISGVAVANGVVYFQSMFDGTLFALDAETGSALAAVPIGLSNSGPSVSRGTVYVGTGSYFVPPGPGSITALGL
jgi:outer membrane protein assembly factor BamB